jgi:1-acyl-sn-glycerol-3-phosphate acyltransferase
MHMEKAVAAQHQPADWRENLKWYTHTTLAPRFFNFIGVPVLSLLMRVKVIDADKLPAGPCILAANHISNFDVLLIGIYLPRYPFYMAKEELFFKNRILSWIYRVSGVFPIKRGRNDTWAFRQAGKVLEAGQMLAMFPEGTRGGHKAKLRKGKPGTVMLALEYGVPIAPVAITGTQHVKIGRARPKATLQVGEPLDALALAGPPPHTSDTVREITTLMMQRIAAMLPPAHQGAYA